MSPAIPLTFMVDGDGAALPEVFAPGTNISAVFENAPFRACAKPASTSNTAAANAKKAEAMNTRPFVANMPPAKLPEAPITRPPSLHPFRFPHPAIRRPDPPSHAFQRPDAFFMCGQNIRGAVCGASRKGVIFFRPFQVSNATLRKGMPSRPSLFSVAWNMSMGGALKGRGGTLASAMWLFFSF
jgi:hypothetical protein